jgi:UDP-2,4-diacetamido-2,4,6-trideoxy-beta-L-altropyranose hydrolase
MKERYTKLVPKKCLQLLGPKFALLRPEFKNARKKLKRKHKLRRILVSFGGSDPTNQTSKVLRAIMFLDSRYEIDVVVGNSNPYRRSIKHLCSSIPSVSFHYHVNDVAKFMANADLAVGGGGSMTWERCCLGLPTIVAILSENQRLLTEEVAKIGCVINLGQASYLNTEDYTNAIKRINLKMLQKMSKRCLFLVDGNGTRRVTSKIFQLG